MNAQERLIALFRDHPKMWIAEQELLKIIPEVVKLFKEIELLKSNGWEISNRTIKEPYEVENGISLRLVTQYLYMPPTALKGWSCTRCANVYTPVSGEPFGDSTIDPRHRQSLCWRCKKKTFWRRIDE